ncbi:UNVERIFIED_CONTAM: hypothetical protein Slati_1746700 [Sesamum latifolium]|uniref:Uncharacterized protein n=1 Tax=Sesamum latifolium TaxID=2727402 RepID=A0AAW2WXC1_9LAMI
MKKELARCQEQLKEATENQVKWKDRYNREVASGQSFLKSEAGKIYLECVWSDFKEKYEGSEEFEGAVVARANDIYDEAIRQCRTKLRECGRFEGRISCSLTLLLLMMMVLKRARWRLWMSSRCGCQTDVGGDRP